MRSIPCWLWLLTLAALAQVSVAPLAQFADAGGNRISVQGVTNVTARSLKLVLFNVEKKGEMSFDLDREQWKTFRADCEKAVKFTGKVPKDGFVAMGLQTGGGRALSVAVASRFGTRLVAVGIATDPDQPYLCVVDKTQNTEFRKLLTAGDRFLAPGKVP